MTDEQKQHLERIRHEFIKAVGRKYAGGAAEHGGNLWEKDILWLLDQAIDEAIDQYVYLITLKERLEAAL